MKVAKLLHNPKAGEAEYTHKKLARLINRAGYDCSYSSTKKEGWENIKPAESDMIVIAGGDGTVRKVARVVLDKNMPLALLPLGTANNIARTLGIRGTPEEVIDGWEGGVLKPFDVGRIYGLKKQPGFFLEGIGYGVFPRLMKEMKKKKDELPAAPEENLKVALETLHDIILSSKARYCKISLDGADYSGKFLLVEVMNTQSIGPNLNLTPVGDPGDGEFEVILVSERQRDEFAAYVHNKLHGIEQPPIFNILKAKNLEMYWEGKLLHVDDEIVQLKKSKDIRIKLQEGLLKFLVKQEELQDAQPTPEKEKVTVKENATSH
ncbi:MAG TPA: diacylglycerol kinase family protein [Chryseosolibacter sp.]